MKTIWEAKELLAALPRRSLGFYPTHLHRLERLSQQLGVELYLKRDDLSGCNLFGGNKMRKLEFLLGEALAKGCDTVFTYGATQSNHAMQTAAACRQCGLNPVLWLVSVVEPDPGGLRANLLLDHIFGAKVQIVPLREGETEAQAEERSFQLGAEEAARLEAAGHRCYDVPMGGASPVGSAGFISGWVELMEQGEAMGFTPDYVCHATGTGGTLAGLAAGRALLGQEQKTAILSVAVSPKDEGYEERTAALANRTLELLKASERVAPKDLWVERDYYAPGYEIPNEAGNKAIRLLARTEGILLDTVYSGKGFAGMLDQICKGRIPQGSRVVYWHTGGATALFAEREIIGDLAEK